MDIKVSAKSFYEKCVRVWHIMKKPTKQEFQNVSKVSAIGILIIGLMGFLISLSMKLFVK
ncbi:MAG: protein translocase SEC61 complex subunit gamma [archaeon]|nr:protein translocase SEC61 complex subunit gamma [archaeon]